jgi:hypothetical protein
MECLNSPVSTVCVLLSRDFCGFEWVDHEFLVRFCSTLLIFAPFFTTSMALLYDRGEKDARGKKEFSWKFFSFPV